MKNSKEQTSMEPKKRARVEFESGQEAALELEFREDLDKLRFIYQYVLNLAQLRIDTVVIHKYHKDVRLKNEIGSFFREYNIIEWKAPEDDLDEEVYLKTLGYACLFCTIGFQGERITRETVAEAEDAGTTGQDDEAEESLEGARGGEEAKNGSSDDDVRKIPQKDVTITLARDAYPRKLFESFTEKGYDYKEVAPGIFHVDMPEFPIQVLVSSRMNEDDHLWLKAPKRGISEALAKKLLQAGEDVKTHHERMLADAVLGTSMKANTELFKKILKGDGKMNQDIKEFLEHYFRDELREFGIELDRERETKVAIEASIKATIQAYRDVDVPEAEIKARIMKKFDLDEKTAEDYMKSEAP